MISSFGIQVVSLAFMGDGELSPSDLSYDRVSGKKICGEVLPSSCKLFIKITKPLTILCRA